MCLFRTIFLQYPCTFSIKKKNIEGYRKNIYNCNNTSINRYYVNRVYYFVTINYKFFLDLYTPNFFKFRESILCVCDNHNHNRVCLMAFIMSLWLESYSWLVIPSHFKQQLFEYLICLTSLNSVVCTSVNVQL